MTQYTARSRDVIKKKKEQHPVWRGIGCALVVIIPIMSAAASVLTVDNETIRGYIPYQLFGNPTLPSLIYKSTALASLLYPFTTWTNFYAYLTVFALYVLFLGGFISFIYALAYRYVGTPRWGPLDMPPANIKTKKYKR